MILKLPFTPDQFFTVFTQYNAAVWPAQLIFYFLGFLAVGLALQQLIPANKIISLILSLFWLWMGIVYHYVFFSTVNRAAVILALFFVLQGILFIIAGVLKHRLAFRFRLDTYGITGVAFFIYALIIYPALGYVLGHRYPATPTFGVPCPTTIFTFGLLLWTDRRIPLYLLPIPLAWSLIGFWAAISLGVTEDFGLLAAGLICALLLIVRDQPDVCSVFN